MSCEIVLLGAARQAVIEMERPEQLELAAALSTELSDSTSSPTVAITTGATPGGDEYLATALTSGHVVVYREMTAGELEDLKASVHRVVEDCGYAIFDILTGGDGLAGGAIRI